MSSLEPLPRREREKASRASLRLVTTGTPAKSSWAASNDHTIELKLGFRELVLIRRSLEAIRSLGLVERQDNLLTDTLQLIDVALDEAV